MLSRKSPKPIVLLPSWPFIVNNPPVDESSFRYMSSYSKVGSYANANPSLDGVAGTNEALVVSCSSTVILSFVASVVFISNPTKLAESSSPTNS